MKDGRVFKRHGQAYQCVGEREHLTRDGRYTPLLVVVSFCAECGAPFRFLTTPGRAARGKLNRRCDEHKRPGVPVPQKRKAPPKRRQPVRRAKAPGAPCAICWRGNSAAGGDARLVATAD